MSRKVAATTFTGTVASVFEAFRNVPKCGHLSPVRKRPVSFLWSRLFISIGICSSAVNISISSYSNEISMFHRDINIFMLNKAHRLRPWPRKLSTVRSALDADCADPGIMVSVTSTLCLFMIWNYRRWSAIIQTFSVVFSFWNHAVFSANFVLSNGWKQAWSSMTDLCQLGNFSFALFVWTVTCFVVDEEADYAFNQVLTSYE